MSTGWIKVHRSLVEHDLWLSEPFTRGQAWVDLLLLANHKSGSIRRRGIKVNVRRGEVGMSLRELAGRWKWSLGKVQRYFEELKADTQIHYRTDTEKVSVTNLISLTNYEKYQLGDTETDTETGIKKGTETDTETGTEQECKEGKEEKDSLLLEFFGKLWSAYPRRDGRKAALRHFMATVKTQEDMDQINLALGNYLGHVEGTALQFIKTGSTWFNNWRDWIPEEETDAA